jgi:hypothetical protein
MCSSVRTRKLQEQWHLTAILRRIRRSLGRRSRPLGLQGRESTEEQSKMTAVFNCCDAGRMVAAAAAIQRQCERVRRRGYIAVRKSGEYVVVVSFAVSVAIALRHRQRAYSSFIAIYSSSPSLRHVLLLSRHVCVTVVLRFVRCFALTCGCVALSVCHGLILFFPCRPVCLSVRDISRDVYVNHSCVRFM